MTANAQRLILLFMLMAPIGAYAAAPEKSGSKAGVIRLGLIQTLFRDMDGSRLVGQMDHLSGIMSLPLGCRLSLELVPDAQAMGRLMQSGHLQLGMVHGVEYGWARKHCPEIRPLAVACNHTTELRAYLLVNRDSPARALADLRGRRLVMPRRSLNHTHLFLAECIARQESGQLINAAPGRVLSAGGAKSSTGVAPASRAPAAPPVSTDLRLTVARDGLGFFAERSSAATAEAALEQVLDGKADAVILDGVGLDIYRQRKPGRAARLRVVEQSVAFPTAALVYHPAHLDERATDRIRRGVLGAHNSAFGRQLLNLWRLTGFREVPPDYEDMVNAVVKRFPEKS